MLSDTQTAGAKKRALYSAKVRDRYALWGAIFILPAMLVFLFFRFIPIIYAFAVSVTRWNLVKKMQYVGLANYINIFKDNGFLMALQRSFAYAVIVVVFTLTIALVLAVLFDQKSDLEIFSGRPIFCRRLFLGSS